VNANPAAPTANSPCQAYLGGPDPDCRCTRCGVLPEEHPGDCLRFVGPRGLCANCDRAGCEHPLSVVETREALRRRGAA
jgi:hypothetical protein